MYFGRTIFKCLWAILVTSIGLNIGAQSNVESAFPRQKDFVEDLNQSTLDRNSRSGTCNRIVGSIYGTSGSDERGYCLIPNALNDGLYVAGSKDNKILILEVDLMGEVRWTRTFDLFPGEQEYPFAIILDSDGMLAVSGTTGVISVGGITFILRYDPQNHQVLWAKEYESAPNADSDGIIQKGVGGNYLMANNLNVYNANHIDTQILEIDKNTGDVIPSFSTIYRLSNRESLLEIVYDGNFVYGTGRYRDNGAGENFRNAIVKLDPNDGSEVWAKLGHIPQNQTARLYGSHLLIDNNAIISGCYGDSAGISTSDSKLFLQKTSLDGNLIWISKYELFGNNVYCLGIVKSGNGYVVMCSKKSPETSLIMFKIDTDGKLLWSNTYQFPGIQEAFMNATIGIRGNSKVIEVGNKLVFTGYVTHASGNNDMLIVQTDLEGKVDNLCTQSESYPIVVHSVSSPVFYNFQQSKSTSTPQVATNAVQGIISLIEPFEECIVTEPILTTLDISICDTESFEGYTLSGSYLDTFHLGSGCDSIRILTLTVLPPVESFFFQTICEGEEFLGYTTGGIHLDTFKTMDGCDSVRTVQLNVIACEPECGVVMGSIYGDPDLNETADCLAATPEKDGMYVAGVRNQQVILMKLDLKGIVIWSKVFDAVQNKPEFVNCIMVDSDGHILLSGIAGPAQVSQGGTIYALKYDPIAHQVLWSKEFTTHSQNYNNSIIQKGVGGNYLLSNNPHLGFTDDEEIIELDINTGAPVPSNTRNYSLMGSESVNLLYHEGFVYGVGRYTSNAATEFMRHTIVKIDPDDGSQLWVRMGHIGPDDYARLYGVQMVIDLDEIYSCYSGDPNGTSLSTTKMFVQKTSTSGTLRWVKQYDLPGDNDAVYAITKSGNGLVLLAGQNNNSPGLNLFKIDTDGNIVWSKKIDFDTYVNATPGSKAISKLIEVGNILAFTSISRNASGEDDIFIGRTDLNGESDIPCLTIQSASILVINISNPQFYSVSPTHTNSSSQSKSASLNVSDADVVGKEECIIADTLYSTIVHSMCTGEIYEGYMDSGTYVDQFTSGGGCDSIRTLILDVGLPSVFPVVSFCEGSSFESYDQGGFYVDTIPGIIGCDTVRHLTLIETPVIQTTLDVTICSGAEYSGYNTEGIYTDTFQTTEGCDSVRTLHLSVMSEIMTNQDIQICLGDVYEGYIQAGVYIDTLQSIFGCDSIRHLQLMIVPEEKFINVDVCTGGSFEHYSLPGQYIDTIQGSTSACDTIRHITLVLLPAEKTNISYTICAEDHFNGHTEPGEYSDTLTAADGCITIQTVMLSVREPITSYVEASLCDGLVPGHHVPGIIIDTLISFLGCDSIRTLLLEGPPRYIPNVFTPNNDGNNDIFEIFTSTDSHLDLDYFAIFDRFGDMTYETSAWPVLWDGNRVNGQPHQSGVYAYILIYECGGERIIEHGNITLVK